MLKIGNKVLKIGDRWLNSPDQYNPLGLPPFTIRLKFSEGVTPTFNKGTGVQVSSSPNVWDLTYEYQWWTQILAGQYDLIEVLGANTTGVTSMNSVFDGCNSLTSVPLFDTSSVKTMYNMFQNCSSLSTIPLFNTKNVTNMGDMFQNCSALRFIPLFETSKVTYMSYMFNNCTNVESGALALYQQASTQANPPEYHILTFRDCGIYTQSGAAELAQISELWK